MSLAVLGGNELTRGFLSSVETGRSSISLKALSFVAERLQLPVSYFVDDRPLLGPLSGSPMVNHAEAALAYGLYLRSLGETEEALEYALWAAQSFANQSDVRADYSTAEWQAVLAEHPDGSRLVVVRVEDCHPPGLLAPIPYIDLVGLDEEAAWQRSHHSTVGSRSSARSRCNCVAGDASGIRAEREEYAFIDR